MSETPRTDERCAAIMAWQAKESDWPDFARQLERELAAERERAYRNQEDAERWRIARQRFVAFDWSWNSPPIPVGIFHLPEVREVRAGPEGADAAIDAARRK